jgi:hypothetical protein
MFDNASSGSIDKATAARYGGKAILKYAPTANEIAAGIRQQNSLFVWTSPDGKPRFVMIDVGRLANGAGGPDYPVTNAANASGNFSGALVSQLTGGGGTFPLGVDPVTGAVLSYRATAEIVLGTPGTMQDPFWVDINRGQRFTAVASYVAITAQMNAPPGDTVTTLPVKLAAGAVVSGSLVVYGTIGEGINPSLAPVVVTQYIDNMSGSQVVGNPYAYNLVVPPRANILLPIVTPGGAAVGGFQLIFYDVAFTPLGQTQTFTGAAPMTVPIELPQDCYRIAIIDKSGFTENYRIVYQLSV